MTKKILVDSSAIIGFFFNSESSYDMIQEYVKHNREEQWVILSTVFSETMTWFRARCPSKMVISVGEILRTECEYVNITQEDDTKVWEIFRKYADKPWSYTDCSLLALSHTLNIPRILTVDHHFRQMSSAGIIVCPD